MKPFNVITVNVITVNVITVSKDDRVVSPDFATFSRPGELANRRLFAVEVPFGWDQDVGVKMSFDNTKPMKINFRQNLRGLFIERL